ncbi:dynein beta chain, ciliary [Trichonephila clavipes]|nr:dynein beta chain, ciliary [Trichonephila clavipes]
MISTGLQGTTIDNMAKNFPLLGTQADIGSLYLRAGVKNIGSLFMISDAQVADERFLVLINDLLSSGDIPDLFPEAEVENIISALRSEVKSAGIYDSRENCWNYFINKVKRRLKVVLCFSPVGSTLRSRSRKFPTLISCTCTDWFHPWPKDALVTVCNRFLQDLPILQTHQHPDMCFKNGLLVGTRLNTRRV